jgi:Pilus formation protein N terminal region
VRAFGVAALCALLPVLVPAAGATAGQGAPTTFTVHVIGGTTRTALRLQPGFATVLRADHRVETVAIGDPRLVTATTVKRGQDVFDLVLQPQTATGVTNMIVWFGELTAIWDLTIGPGQRTADIVYVVTAPPVPAQSTPGVVHPAAPVAPTAPTAPASGPAADPAPRAQPSRTAPASPASAGESYLEIQQAFPEAQAIFQLFRERAGVRIRYRITNKSVADVAIRSKGVLIRVNGRLIPFGMSRESVDKDRPAILPAGATETGVIGAPVRAPRQVEVIFSLFPAEEDRRGPSRTVPATFQLVFSGLDRLSTSTTP